MSEKKHNSGLKKASQERMHECMSKAERRERSEEFKGAKEICVRHMCHMGYIDKYYQQLSTASEPSYILRFYILI